MNLYSILDKIENRPGLYLSQPSFGALCDFVSGYEFALASNHINEQESPPFSGFNVFALRQLGRERESSPNVSGQINANLITWKRAISEVIADDSAKISIFFDLLRSYRGMA